MEKQHHAPTPRLVFGLVALFFLSAVASYGLEAKLSLDNDRFVVGQKFNVDLLVNTDQALKVQLVQPAYPAGLKLTTGPFTRATTWTNASGQTVTGTRITLSFRVVASGIVSLGPFTLTWNGQSVVVPARPLYLLEPDEAKNRFPLEVRWKVRQGPYYQGQDIPIILQVQNLETLVPPTNVDVPAPANALWEKSVGLGEIEITAVGDDRILSLPWGVWMLIPTQSGTVTLPAVTVNVSGLIRQTAPLVLNILPLPSEVDQTRALGDFTYKVSVQRDGLGPGQFALVQEVRGQGNFPYLVFPNVAFPGLTLVSQQETSGYHPTMAGYEGSLVQTRVFSAEKPGKILVTLPGFVSFQPDLNKTWTWDPKVVQVSASTPGAMTLPASLPLTPLDVDQVQAARPVKFWTQPWVWLIFLPGPLLLLASFLTKKGRKGGLLVLFPLVLILLGAGDPEVFQQQQALKQWNSQDFVKAHDTWQALAEAHPGEPGYWFNLGLATEKLKRSAEAVQAFENALASGFQGPQALQALRTLEKKQQLSDQFPVWQGPDLAWILLGVALAWNGLFVFWFLNRWTGRASWIIGIGLSLLLLVVAGGTLAVAVSDYGRVNAVVGPTDAPLRRVPGALAEDWLTLRHGTTVAYQGFSGNYALVVSGYGLEGWVQLNYLLPVQETLWISPRF
jgi:hypothetical protein